MLLTKKISPVIFYLFFLSILLSKDLHITRTGYIEFFSTTPIEDIKAVNNQVSCVLDKNSGSFAFQVPIKAFTFKNALMQEHFNESYLESDIYPKSTFKGKILNWKDLKLTTQPQDIKIEGELTMHGIKKSIIEMGSISQKKSDILGQCVFIVALRDFDIKVPKIVRENIAEVIKVTVKVDLAKK